jgi:phosphoglycerate-specific signal transduction histidine kinase
MVFYNYNKQRIANRRLREAQEELIRREKMAAFGVMATRVSHEILNPLNFVNNFSELSLEIANDIATSENEFSIKRNTDLLITNLKKINEHGNRISDIIKELQKHSVKGTAKEYFEPESDVILT